MPPSPTDPAADRRDTAPAPLPAAAAAKPVVRRFARFELRRLLGRSARTMCWLVFDPRTQAELVLVLPRQQMGDAESLERWHQAARKAQRLDHPNLAPIVEAGDHERWPYLAYERQLGTTLAERLDAQGQAAADVAGWCVQVLAGLAFAHEAGAAHHDLQAYSIVVPDQGPVKLMGLEAAHGAVAVALEPGAHRNLSVDTRQLRAQRDNAERDVLALGVLLHHLLTGQPALEEPDTGSVIDRLPPLGRDIVRLSWSVPRPIPEALRAIVNRGTDRQERQRYRNARTLARALSGFLEQEAQQGGEPHAQLLERIRIIGVLPGMPGGADRAARMALMERERTFELAQVVLRDVGLAFEVLRAVNVAQARGGQLAADGPVLTVRRAIAMIGMDGVRRCALGLRRWPGPLGEEGARQLQQAIERAQQAARIAQALRPPGYDPEVVQVVTLLQNLGRLVVQYHFPDEAQQVRKLMQAQPSSMAGEPDEPGMSEEAASFAVLGCDIEALGAAVARHWNFDEGVLQMMRRLPLKAAVRQPDGDDDMMRAVASAGIETVDALQLPAKQVASALERVVQRYGRMLEVSLRDLQAAIQAAAESAGTDRLPEVGPKSTATGEGVNEGVEPPAAASASPPSSTPMRARAEAASKASRATEPSPLPAGIVDTAPAALAHAQPTPLPADGGLRARAAQSRRSGTAT